MYVTLYVKEEKIKSFKIENLHLNLNKEFILKGKVNDLRRIYNNVDDIDLFVGMLSERPQTDSILGVTALCIIGRFLLLFNYVYLGRY